MNDIKLKTIFLDDLHLNGGYDSTTHQQVQAPIRFGLYSDKFAKFMVELAAEFGQNNGDQLPYDAIRFSYFDCYVSQTFVQLFQQNRGFFDIVPGGYYANREATNYGRIKIFKNQFGEVCMTKANFITLDFYHDQEQLRHYFSRCITNLVRYSVNTKYNKKFPEQFLHTSFSIRDALLIICLLESNPVIGKHVMEPVFSKEEIAEMVGQKIEIDCQTSAEEKAVIDNISKECAEEFDKLAKAATNAIKSIVDAFNRDRYALIKKFEAKVQAAKADLPHATVNTSCPRNK